MCGLVGMMGALDTKHRDVMKDLLYLDTLRGTDSTGVASVDRQRKVQLRKLTVPGFDFVQMGFINSLMGVGDQLWLGHNRFKTRGNVNRMNAHPFEVNDKDGYITTIGAHNGTLDNQWEIEKALGDKRFGTDSEALINLIDDIGAKDAIAIAKGAWSLVWWDATPNELCFLRNDKRPMFFAYTEDRKVLIWASEVWMILAACNRNGVKLETNENGLSCYSTTIDTLYRFKIPQDKSAIAPPEKEGGLLGAPEKAPFLGGNERFWQEADKGNNFAGRYSSTSQSQTGTQTTQTTATTETKGNVVTIGGTRVKGYNGTWISPKERDDVADKGCGWCGGPLEKTKMAFVSPIEALCVKCCNAEESIVLGEQRKIVAKKG